MKNFMFDWEIISSKGFYDLSSNEKLLLLYLKAKIDNQERIPEQQEIAQEIGCSRRYIPQYSQRLQAAGLLVIERYSDPFHEKPNEKGNFLSYKLPFIPTSSHQNPKKTQTTYLHKCKYCKKEVPNIIEHFENEHRDNPEIVKDFRECYKLLFSASKQSIKESNQKTKAYFHFLGVLLPLHIIRTANAQLAEIKDKKHIKNLPAYFVSILRTEAKKEGYKI